MQYSSGPDPVQKLLQIGQDDKFYCKLLSKESSGAANPSFRVYYGGASGAVPFRWESLPGTPKHPSMAGAALPPLTPPPSYQSRGTRSAARKCSSSAASSRSSLLNSILPARLTHRRPRAPSTSSPSGSLSSSSVSSSSASSNYRGRSRSRSRFSSPRSSFSSTPDDDESDAGSPTSTLCFGHRRGGFRRWYRMVVVKNALLSIVGRGGSGQGAAA